MKVISGIVVSLAALCLAQPFASSGPGLSKTASSVRVNRQRIVKFPCRCPGDQVWLKTRCVSCEKYLDLTGDDSCPICPPNTTANNIRAKRQAMILIPSQVQCPIGQVWLNTRCITCKMQLDAMDTDFSPECPQTTSTTAPDQPKNAFNVRVKRQSFIKPSQKCPSGQVSLHTGCVTCQKYYEITDDDHPECSTTTTPTAPDQLGTANNVRVKRQHLIDVPCRCPKGRIWLKIRCVTCEKYLDLTGAESCPVCRPVKFRKNNGKRVKTSKKQHYFNP